MNLVIGNNTDKFCKYIVVLKKFYNDIYSEKNIFIKNI